MPQPWPVAVPPRANAVAEKQLNSGHSSSCPTKLTMASYPTVVSARAVFRCMPAFAWMATIVQELNDYVVTPRVGRSAHAIGRDHASFVIVRA